MSDCQFSMGASFRNILCQALGLDAGPFLEQGSNEKDLNRLKNARKASQESSKKKRKALKYTGIQRDQKKQTKKGKIYAAREFNSVLPTCSKT